MSEEKYNGWTNYETWLFVLWMDNEESTCKMMREWAREALDEYAANIEEHKEHDFNPNADSSGYCVQCRVVVRRPTAALADRIKQYASDEEPELGASLWSDLLSAALSSVDWYEVAEHYFPEDEDEAEAEA
jgi:hypothetical protein